MAGVLKYVSSWFGEPTHMRGRYLYADRWRWPNGTELLFTDAEDGTNAEHFCLSIPGGGLAEWEPAERLDRTWELWELGEQGEMGELGELWELGEMGELGEL